jgi:hypothetical protein
MRSEERRGCAVEHGRSEGAEREGGARGRNERADARRAAVGTVADETD